MMSLRRSDWLLAVGLAALALLLRLPFLSQYLYHWDSVNFALSLNHYDVRLHQPHPPGYFLYSLLGSGINAVANNPNTSLSLISLIGGVLGVVALYWLGKAMFGREVGIIAALLAVTSPMHWFYSEVALSYALEFFLVTLIAGLCYLQWSGSRRVWPLLALLLAAAGGVRQNDLVFLLPLWLVSLYPLGWRERIGSVVVLGVGVLVWFVPMAALSGGLGEYLAAVRGASEEIGQASVLVSFNELALNVGRMVIYLGYSILLGIVPLLWGIWRAARHPRALLADKRAWVIVLWTAPAFVFYIVVHLRQHGHVFTFLPAIYLLIALSITDLARQLGRERWQRVAAGVTAVVAAAAGLFFLLAPPALLGMKQVALQTPSRATIAARDAFLGERVTAIRDTFDPATTIVLGDSVNFRHPDFYFADFQEVELSEAAVLRVPENVRAVVLLGDDILPQLTAETGASFLTLPDGDTLRYVSSDDGDGLNRLLMAEPNAEPPGG